MATTARCGMLASATMYASIVASVATDRAQKLAAQRLATVQFTEKGLRDHSFIAASVFTEKKAQLLGFNHARGAEGLAVMHQCFGNVTRHPFLIGEAMTDGVHHPGDAAKTMQAPTRKVRDVSKAAKGNQVVRADPVYGNAPDDDEITSVVGKAVPQLVGRVALIATEQSTLPQFAHSLRRTPEMDAACLDATGSQQSANSLFKSIRIKRSCGRNANVTVSRGRIIMVARIGHEGWTTAGLFARKP